MHFLRTDQLNHSAGGVKRAFRGGRHSARLPHGDSMYFSELSPPASCRASVVTLTWESIYPMGQFFCFWEFDGHWLADRNPVTSVTGSQ